MADLGHELTEDMLKELEKEIAQEYRVATNEVEKKLREYLRETEAQRKVQEQLWKDGAITKKEYTDWCFRHEMVGKRWEEMKETLAADYHKANQIALGITKNKMPDVYALNVNYATYQIEHDGRIDTGFTLYNHDTAAYLLGDQRQLMPKASKRKAAEIAKHPDMQWNMRKIQSSVLQGVLQGEDANRVAYRLQEVGQMNYNSAVRYARTMTTSAQNAGRYEGFRRAEALGVELTIEWQATLDHRTRHDHRLMHGQRTEVDKPFHTPDGFTIYYPADCTGMSTAPQKEIWNCRCTLLAWVKGFEGDTVTHSDKMGDMTFEEWQKGKAVNSTDIEQYKEYKKLLKGDAPKDFTAFYNLKYNKPKEWEYTKGLASYLRKYPTSSKPYYEVQRALKGTKFKGSVALPPRKKRAYILPSGKRDSSHIMKRMQERGITDDMLRGYIEDAKVMLVQWGGERQAFVGANGVAVITKVDSDWIFKTAWTKYDYDEEMERIMGVINRVGL